MYVRSVVQTRFGAVTAKSRASRLGANRWCACSDVFVAHTGRPCASDALRDACWCVPRWREAWRERLGESNPESRNLDVELSSDVGDVTGATLGQADCFLCEVLRKRSASTLCLELPSYRSVRLLGVSTKRREDQPGVILRNRPTRASPMRSASPRLRVCPVRLGRAPARGSA